MRFKIHKNKNSFGIGINFVSEKVVIGIGARVIHKLYSVEFVLGRYVFYVDWDK